MMNKKISTIAGSLVIMAIVIAIGFVFFIGKEKATQSQNNIVLNNSDLEIEEVVKQNEEKIAEDTQSKENKEEPIVIMEDVSFCGKIYNGRKIILKDINVVNRIAILSQNNKFRICENIETNSPDKNLDTRITQQSTSAVDYKDNIYFLNISVLVFKIDLNTNNIYVLGAYAGEPTFIGKLK